jgi:outer membrane translocation and assembly module TamA
MRLRTALQFILLLVVWSALSSSVAHAQVPRRLTKCLPYPTLEEEIEDMRAEVRAKMAANGEAPLPAPKVIIDEIKFDAPIHLPDSVRDELLNSIKEHEFAADSKWLEEIEEVPIRGAWQDNGYFKVKVSAQALPLGGDATHQHYSVIVHVDEGLQYRLGKITFRSFDPDEPLVFPPEELRKLASLDEGEILSSDKIRKALDALKKLYASHGYIDFAPTPETEVDDEHQTVSIHFVLDQQKQYRIGKITLYVSNPELENILNSRLKPGDIFDYNIVHDFLKENESSLPPDASPEDIRLTRNAKTGTVDLLLDFMTCPDP